MTNYEDTPTTQDIINSKTFSYVAYDEHSTKAQEEFKAKFQELELLGNNLLMPGRAASLFKTKLEEAYMWTGKAIRDQQIAKLNSQHEPSRTNA